MAISDTNPERRNLTLTSLAFILYFVAGGEFNDSVIKIVVVNLSFSKPHILAWFAWTLLCWFALRFWQKNGFMFLSSLLSDISRIKVPNSLHDYCVEKAKEQSKGKADANTTNKKIVCESFRFKHSKIHVLCNYTITNGTTTHQEIVPISGVIGLFYTFKVIAIGLVKGNSFAEELLPYLLFCCALTQPIIKQIVQTQG